MKSPHPNLPRIIIITATTAALLFAFAGCGRRDDDPSRSRWTNHIHPNGLSIRIPDSVSAKQIATGFELQSPPRSGVRLGPPRMEITLSDIAAPPGGWSEERSIGKRSVGCIEQSELDSSGGRTYEWDAWESHGRGSIRYRWREQVGEYSEGPDQGLFWSIIEETKVK